MPSCVPAPLQTSPSGQQRSTATVPTRDQLLVQVQRVVRQLLVRVRGGVRHRDVRLGVVGLGLCGWMQRDAPRARLCVWRVWRHTAAGWGGAAWLGMQLHACARLQAWRASCAAVRSHLGPLKHPPGGNSGGRWAISRYRSRLVRRCSVQGAGGLSRRAASGGARAHAWSVRLRAPPQPHPAPGSAPGMQQRCSTGAPSCLPSPGSSGCRPPRQTAGGTPHRSGRPPGGAARPGEKGCPRAVRMEAGSGAAAGQAPEALLSHGSGGGGAALTGSPSYARSAGPRLAPRPRQRGWARALGAAGWRRAARGPPATEHSLGALAASMLGTVSGQWERGVQTRAGEESAVGSTPRGSQRCAATEPGLSPAAVCCADPIATCI